MEYINTVYVLFIHAHIFERVSVFVCACPSSVSAMYLQHKKVSQKDLATAYRRICQKLHWSLLIFFLMQVQFLCTVPVCIIHTYVLLWMSMCIYMCVSNLQECNLFTLQNNLELTKGFAIGSIGVVVLGRWITFLLSTCPFFMYVCICECDCIFVSLSKLQACD